MTHRLIKIDKLTRSDHYYLTNQDQCYYVMEYTSGQDYRYSTGNSLIKNLKKTLERKGKSDWVHKGRAIKQIAEIFAQIFPEGSLDGTTIVPVPSSKSADDPLYDDRLMQVLSAMTNGYDADIRELFYLEESIGASHASGDDRPSPEELEAVYKVKKKLCKPPPERIIIFDDMITAGSHFRACKNMLQELFPEAEIIGVFITRRTFLPNEEDETED